MSSLRDLRLQAAKDRQKATLSKKHLSSDVWEAMVMKNWKPYSRWEKQQIIRQGYERNAPFYAACNIIAQTIASIPVYVEYEKRGRIDRTKSHPILKVIERDSSWEEFMEMIVLYFLVTGESYQQIVFSELSGKRRPLGLIPLPSQYVTPVYGDNINPISHYEFAYQKQIDIPREEMIAIMRPDLTNYFKGMSPGVPLSETLDLHNAAIEWNKNVALAGGTPPIVALAKGGMQPEDAREAQRRYMEQAGSKNAHLLRFLGGDIEIKDLGTDPHDAEWGNAVLMTMRMILMSLGVSSSLMNDAANKTYNNVKDSRKALYLDACLPITDKILRVISRGLKRYYDDNPVVKADREGIEALQEDTKSKVEWVIKAVDSGLFTRNEGRSKLRMPLSNDPIANQLIISNRASDMKKPDDSLPSQHEPALNGQTNGIS